jgi:hypothetical protein
MTPQDFRQSLSTEKPPEGLTPAMRGVWWHAKGDWTQAHESVQQDEGSEGSWVHAYLHRKEGDAGNAGYWYSRAGKPFCRQAFDAEWLIALDAFFDEPSQFLPPQRGKAEDAKATQFGLIGQRRCFGGIGRRILSARKKFL